MPIEPLNPDQLYHRCDPDSFRFETTDDLENVYQSLGQDRAVEALRFGVRMRHDGYNIFVLGPPGTGRHSLVSRVLEHEAAKIPAPSDWAYVNNFETPHQPKALKFPAGQASAFRSDMRQLVEDLRSAIPALFESDEYRTRLHAIEEEYKDLQESRFKDVQDDAEKRGLTLLRTPVGFAVAPTHDNEVMPPEEFNSLPEDERTRIEEDIKAVQKKLQETVKNLPIWERERRKKVRDLSREMTSLAVANVMEALKRKYRDQKEVRAHLEAVEADIIDNVQLFLGGGGGQQSGGQSPGGGDGGVLAPRGESAQTSAERRYEVNIMVGDRGDGEDSTGAPVVKEDLPTHPNLVGRVEHVAEMGALLTDFTLIKPGALHRANGGFLVIDALRLLMQPYAWETLKRALRAKHVKVESLGQMMSLISTVSLEPEPIPLDVKVVLIGDRSLYYMLCRLDPDFDELFKVQVDFEEDVRRDDASIASFTQVLKTISSEHDIKPLDRSAVARVVEHASRMAEDAEKLSVQVGRLTDLLREADFWAGEAGHDTISADDVQAAIDAGIRRASRIRARMQEAITRDIILIDTDGTKVGQINGLSVLQLGTFSFGRPSRITARVRIGSGEVLDIERRVELGGPIHSKGVMILSSYLGARYAANHPLSLTASLVFEQSYSGVDGDSASSAELYALLSALSGLAINQGLAVTGSVNQYGQVQAIGGVNEKIEGYFDICKARGLTGRQGVLIPRANIKHLMLRHDVVEAAKQGRFHIYAVSTIDEGIEILTGTPAGVADENGVYPEGTVNRLVQDRLAELAETRHKFAARGVDMVTKADGGDKTDNGNDK